jgi:16S rRNA (cytosine1402-N4)-methyltransferase
VYVDATLGGGGHAEALLERLSAQGRLLGIDADGEAIAFARQRLKRFGNRVELIHDNFRNLSALLADRSLSTVTGVLFDLGVSSHQLDDPHRGFSFQSDERLDMRMDQRLQTDAAAILNSYSREQLARIFSVYGEERLARPLAARIVQARATAPLQSTAELARIVRERTGERFAVKSLARVFQALRIEVNRELDALEHALPAAISALETGGRIVVIAYHSLEDRIVKQRFRDAAARSSPRRSRFAPPEQIHPSLRLLTRSPVEADEEEIQLNPRARSAKLRAAERIAGPGGTLST